MSYKEIIDNVSNIEDLDNTTILKVLEKFSKAIKDFAIEQSGLNNLVNVEFIPSDNNTTYTGDSVDYLGTLKLTLSDNIIVNKPCSVKFNIKGSNTIVVNVDEFNNSLELHLDNSVVTTLDFAESERQKSITNGAIVHEKEIADVEHIETIYDMSSSDSNINKGYTSGLMFSTTPSYSIMGESQKNKYKCFRATARLVNTYLIFEFMNNIDAYARGGFACQASWLDDTSFCFGHISIAPWGTINGTNCRTQNGSTVTDRRDDTSYYISKIEGVLL